MSYTRALIGLAHVEYMGMFMCTHICVLLKLFRLLSLCQPTHASVSLSFFFSLFSRLCVFLLDFTLPFSLQPCLFVYDLHVLPELQRKGVGRHLVTMLELIARKVRHEAVGTTAALCVLAESRFPPLFLTLGMSIFLCFFSSVFCVRSTVSLMDSFKKSSFSALTSLIPFLSPPPLLSAG